MTPRSKARRPAPRRPHQPARRWELVLYVADLEPRSVEARANLTRLCKQYLPGRHKIAVVDLLKKPKRAAEDQILAIPTVERRWPLPEIRVIGGLSDTERVTAALGLRGAG